MKHSLFWAAVEAAAKATRSGLSVVGALVDCGIPRQHAGEQWLTAAEEEIEVWEAPLSADHDDEPPAPFRVSRRSLGEPERGTTWQWRSALEPKPKEHGWLYDWRDGQWGVRGADGAEPWLMCGPDDVCGAHGRFFSVPKTPAAGANGSAVEDLPEHVPPACSGTDSKIPYRGEELSWCEYVIPAILDVLAEHRPYEYSDGGYVWCLNSAGHNHATHGDWTLYEWREHVAPILAARLEAVTLALPEM